MGHTSTRSLASGLTLTLGSAIGTSAMIGTSMEGIVEVLVEAATMAPTVGV